MSIYYDYGQAIIRKVSQDAPVVMTLQKMKGEGKTCIRGVVREDDEEVVVGEVVYERFRSGIRADGQYGSPNHPACSYEQYGTGDDVEQKVPKIYVELLHNFDRRIYKDVGTKLIHTVIKIALNGESQGRVELESTARATPFYRKQGFRTMTPSCGISPAEVDQIIESRIQNPLAEILPMAVEMYLPTEAIKKLKPALVAEPIFFPKRKMSRGC